VKSIHRRRAVAEMACQQAMEDAFTQMMARMQTLETELVQQRAGGAQAQAQTDAAMQHRLQAMEGELLTQRAQNALLQSQVSAAAARTTVGSTRAVVDTRGLGKPDSFDGSATK
jgi:hypothetical protein